MKAILDRYAERLTAEERQVIWETISEANAVPSRTSMRLALSGAVAMAVVGVVTVTVMQREPALMNPITPSEPVARALQPDPPAPVSNRVPPPEGATTLPAPLPNAIRTRATVVPEAVVPSASVPVVKLPEAQMSEVVVPPAAQASPSPLLGGSTGVLSSVPGVEVGRLVPAAGQRKPMPVKMLEGISVRAEKRIDVRSSTTKHSISAEKLRELPVDHLRDAIGQKAGVVAQGDALQFRGGRSGEVTFQVNGAVRAPARPPVGYTTGGTALPNDEAFDSMFFKNYGVNPFIAADEDPLSTFAVDVDAASYTVMRRYVGLGQLPPADAVRVEEFVNFFPQGYSNTGSEDFRVLVDGAPSPFGPGYHLVRIGLKGREIADRNRLPAQLTFVIDVSGSMQREDRLELVKRALRLLVERLHADDRVGIIIYGSVGSVLLEPVAVGGSANREDGAAGAGGEGRRRILEAIDQLGPGGSTNAEEGLRLGYAMAQRAFRPKGLNRIVLCSDGVANVGRTGPGSILEQVRTEAAKGIHLTTIGFGMGNYNDVLMEQLANRGDGNYYYVDDIDEARRVFVEKLTGTLQTIAKDAKIQVEFDSTRVLRYRLLGFENRDVADRDFRNDKVDAGEIGAGHEVTALYEVKLAPGTTRGTFATVRMRYALPETDGAGAPRVREIQKRFDVAALEREFGDASAHFRLDAAVAECAEILRGSYWAKESRLSDVLSVARSAARGLRDETTAEFVLLVEKAAALSGKAKPAGGGREE